MRSTATTIVKQDQNHNDVPHHPVGYGVLQSSCGDLCPSNGQTSGSCSAWGTFPLILLGGGWLTVALENLRWCMAKAGVSHPPMPIKSKFHRPIGPVDQ
eukprot:6740005-Karenia_brevis.AAC.1